MSALHFSTDTVHYHDLWKVYIMRKRTEKIAIIDQLIESISSFKSSSSFKDLLKYVTIYNHMKPFNLFLISVQKPGAQISFTPNQWEKYNRTIKPGARPLIILKPFGPVDFVFSIDDTEGDALPFDQFIDPFSAGGNFSPHFHHRLFENLPKIGIQYDEQQYGGALGGFIQRAEREHSYPIGKKMIKHLATMIINANHSKTTQAVTILHELGHFYAGHLGEYSELSIPDRSYLPKEIKEFEAESISYIFSQRFGITTNAIEYIHSYLGSNPKIPNVSIETILVCSGKIEDIVSKSIVVPKGIIS